ncbi:MAG TPA: helix-turn-helix transcriptional regulator [Lichenihabitans sp.]|jgi:transcriptional regulator with XRE-family HTH domain|nr:helix-turn-helix transcriptional regulator [Lichenihabitans sp.]
MSRTDTTALFRRRLESVMARSGLTPAGFARRAGIDRSTLSQLMSPDALRLPRAETLVAIAGVAHVSVDWLLGLSQREEIGAEIIEALLQIETHDRLPADDHFGAWLSEAQGYRIRTVPVALPDFMKSEAVLRLEYRAAFEKAAPSRLEAVKARLRLMAGPENDVEVCVTLQAFWALAEGRELWQGLSRHDRIEQIDHMADLYRAAYPGLRLYLYDHRDIYSAPFTVFGPKRAILFLGHSYLVLNGSDHIRMFARRFDEMIRLAVVQPHAVEATLRALRDRVG